jgi:hypothetical protein
MVLNFWSLIDENINFLCSGASANIQQSIFGKNRCALKGRLGDAFQNTWTNTITIIFRFVLQLSSLYMLSIFHFHVCVMSYTALQL